MFSHFTRSTRSWWKSGQSLVEVTVASTAMIFGLVAIISSLLLAVRNSSASNKEALATQHAQEVIELFRQFQRELGWESFYEEIRAGGTSGTYCLMNLPANTSEIQNVQPGNCNVSSTYTGFVREVDVVVDSTTQITFTVHVSWRDGPNTRSIAVTHIYRNFK